jgi:hypothetical protein
MNIYENFVYPDKNIECHLTPFCTKVFYSKIVYVELLSGSLLFVLSSH